MSTGRLQLLKRFSDYFIALQIKNWKNIDADLIVFRVLSIVFLFVYGSIDTVMYSSRTVEKSDFLKFLHGSRYLALEILVIIYSSGVAAFGMSFEIYPLFLHNIANCVLIVQNCGGSDMVNTTILWVIKVFFLLIAVELCHRNFRKLRDYNNNFNSSTRAMLRQALYFSVTILLLDSLGLGTLYHAIDKFLPRLCAYETGHCGIVDLY
jgi:hypothetical protein